jgi:hypothetical protein
MRWIFRGAVLVALGVLAVDLADINGWIIYPAPAAAPAEIREEPALNLPRVVPSIFAPLLSDGGKRLVPLPQSEGAFKTDDIRTGRRRPIDGKWHHHTGNFAKLCGGGRTAR